MMNEQENVQVVQQLFVAFGQGNIVAGLYADSLSILRSCERN